MDLKDILLEVKFSKIKRKFEDYLDGEGPRYDFPYLPDARLLVTTASLGDYGSALKLVLFEDGRKSASALILESGRVLYRNDIGVRVGEDQFDNVQQVLGRLVEIR